MYEKVAVKFNGDYYEFDVTNLDLDPNNLTDEAIKSAVGVAIREVFSSRGETISTPNFAGFVVDPPFNERNADDTKSDSK